MTFLIAQHSALMPNQKIRDTVGNTMYVHNKLRRASLATTVIMLLMLPACNDENYTCPQNVNPSLHVAVVDSATLRPLTVTPSMTVNISGIIGAEVGLSKQEPATFLVFGSPGVYSFAVTASGYQPFAQSGIVVAKSQLKCGNIVTNSVTARMQKT